VGAGAGGVCAAAAPPSIVSSAIVTVRLIATSLR